jgi:hypothetical protein
MLSLTLVVGTPYRVLHRSKETRHAMTAAVAKARADPDGARAVLGTEAAELRAPAGQAPHLMNASDRPSTALFVVDTAGRPVGTLHVHDLLRAGIV